MNSNFEPPLLRQFRDHLLRNESQMNDGNGSSIFIGPHQPLRAVTAREFLGMEIKPREMLVDPIMPSQGLLMLHAKRGLGKTHLAISIGVAAATGKPFLRWRVPKPRKVLYVDGEMPASALQRWVAEAVLMVGAEEGGGNLSLITPDLQEFGIPDLGTLEGQAALLRHAEAADLVILDNLSALLRAGRKNEAEGWLPIQAWA